MVTVVLPVALTLFMGDQKPAFTPCLAMIASAAATAFASQGAPLWNFRPGRSWNFQVRPSLDVVQLWASSGTNLPLASAVNSVS